MYFSGSSRYTGRKARKHELSDNLFLPIYRKKRISGWGRNHPKTVGTGVRGQRKNGFSPHFVGVFGPIFGLSPHFREKTNTCSRLVRTNKQTFDGKGDKWGQKGTKGTNFVPIFVPSKTPVYRNKPDFLESRFDGRGQTGDKMGTKMGTKTPKWGILIRPM